MSMLTNAEHEAAIAAVRAGYTALQNLGATGHLRGMTLVLDVLAGHRTLPPNETPDTTPAAPAAPVERSYVFLSDPGHGWLEVPMADVVALGVAKNISGYSYLSKDGANGQFPGHATVYLEEDCDTGTFAAAAARAGWKLNIMERRCEGDCFCRRLPRYIA